MSQAGDAARELLRALSTRIGPPDRPTEHPEDEDCGGLCFAKSCIDKAALKMGLTPPRGATEPAMPAPHPDKR